MRMSQLFSQTLREAPAEADTASHRLLLRAGFIRQLAAGIFSYLPLARRSLTKIENILRQEIEAIGGQEITMPVVHPAGLWQESGRWGQIGAEMGRFKDRTGRDMVLAMTHEEVVADLVRKEVRSYRQLPQLLYHIQTKWRDDPRPRAGLIRVREFTMKDSYSLDRNEQGLDRQYRAHYQAYFNIFQRCGLPVRAVRADTGMMGGSLAHEYMYLTPAGEDTILICPHCAYTANRQIAVFQKPSAVAEEPLPSQPVATPQAKTIEALAEYLGIPKSKTAKAVFLVGRLPQGEELVERFIFAVVRGDMEVNETKLANATGALELRPALEDEILAVGAAPGYASPVGLQDVLVVVDDAIPNSPNLVAGANREGYHLRNVNYGRDYQADIVADIASAEAGSACPQCGTPMQAERGVEVGNIFKLGARYSRALGCNFLDQDGESKPVVMGSYGIGSGRLLACIAEEHHDEYGLIWPVSVAPYPVHLVLLRPKGSQAGSEATNEVTALAERLVEEMEAAGIPSLYDDRDESPGVKFNDADLIGLPIRLTVSERALKQGGVEFKRRDHPEKSILPLDGLVESIRKQIKVLEGELQAGSVEVPFQQDLPESTPVNVNLRDA
jgi:prolyl-tRNA synthetase